MMAFAGTPRIHGLIPLLLILAAYPVMFVVWNWDAVEVERHATQIGIQVRLALWMGSVFVVDFLWARFFQPKSKRNSAAHEAGAA
jgi:membrane protein implicated in regulation of membrane protease activity